MFPRYAWNRSLLSLSPGRIKDVKATWMDYECTKSLIDSLWSMVALISPCPSSRLITAQNQPLKRGFLWGLKYCREVTPEWAICCKMKFFWWLISSSVRKLSMASSEILGWIAHFLHSGSILLPPQVTDRHKHVLDYLIYIVCLHYTSISVSLWWLIPRTFE